MHCPNVNRVTECSGGITKLFTALAAAHGLVACSAPSAVEQPWHEGNRAADTETAQLPNDVKQAANDPDDSALPTQGMADDADEPPDDLVGRIVSAASYGELCPYNPIDQDDDGLADQIQLADHEVVFNLESATTPDTLVASCTITVEVEIPTGYQMGIPAMDWWGVVVGDDLGGGPLTITRRVAFEGGESYSSPIQRFASGEGAPFPLSEENIQVFSSCQTQRVTITAVLEAHRETSESPIYDLSWVNLRTSWKKGTAFRADCSEGFESSPGELGDWCGGSQQRPCAAGLQCEYSVFKTIAEGECIDPDSAATEDAQEGGVCGGARELPCAPGLVCWRPDGASLTEQGICYSNPTTLKNAPCGIGFPVLECALPYHCAPEQAKCLELTGAPGDPCGPSLPECQADAYCAASGNLDGGVCTPWSGQAGAPCGTPEFPACDANGSCQEGRCIEQRGTLGKPCGDFGCRPELLCVDDVCQTRSSVSESPSSAFTIE